MSNNKSWAFFGTSKFSVIVLDELKSKNFLPSLTVTGEDKPKGRKLTLTPPEVKVWATENNVPCLQLETLKGKGIDMIRPYFPNGPEFFVVASYGKIIPTEILEMPERGTLNIHPSLLPKLRGPSPIETAILEESETGVTVIRLDTEIDHGPILGQKKTLEWNRETVPYAEELEENLAHEGGRLLAETLAELLLGNIKEKEQDHSRATFSKKIQKSDCVIRLDDEAEKNLRKIRGYNSLGAYFFQNEKRVVIRKAHIEKETLVIDRVVPEGKKEMDYADFLRGLKSNQ